MNLPCDISKSWRFIMVGALILAATGCDQGPESGFIDPELEPLVTLFAQEGRWRGSRVNVSDLDARFVETIVSNGRTLCGRANDPDSGSGPRIEISRSSSCWSSRHAADREALVFHELGHALLGRGHDDRQMPGGFYRSMMNSRQFTGLYTQISGLSVEILGHKRDYYLDELFNPETPIPAWVSPRGF